MSSYPSLGKYQIIEELGRGGMGAVYKGYDPLLDRTVAIKLLAPHLVWEKDFVERFLREARAAARLDHPNIIHIYDVGQDGSNYYFVMAYLPGPSLKQRISQKGRLTPAEAVPILRQLAEALDYAHSKGLIHRDVKPANVMFNERGQAVLTDFGIAKAAQESKLTTTGATIGTPRYMAPEQILGKKVDARADEYMLSIIAFEMLTGSVPFDADTTPAIFYKQVNDPPPSAVAFCSDLPLAIEVVLNRALAKLPEARYPTCGEFVDALEQIWALPVAPTQLMSARYEKPSEPTPTLPVSQLPADRAAGGQKPPLTPVATLLNRARRRPLSLLLTGIGVAAVVVVVVVTILNSKGQVTLTTIAAVQPTLTSTNTAAPPTNTPAPPTPTASPTNTPMPPTPTMTPTATLGIGSTSVSGKDGMVMVYVPAGEFLMGSTNLDLDARDDEKPQHTVYLDAFWIDKTEVTNATFERFVAAAGYKTDAEKEGWGYAYTGSQWETVKGADWRHPHGLSTSIKGLDDHPVVLVTWNDARTYCQWAGRQLPTEAQWEKAARGTDGRIYPWGNQTATCDYAVMDDGSGDSCGKGIGTWPVGSRPKGVSPYGAFDMAGNVWEWVADRYSKNYYAQSPARQPEGPSSGQYRVLRGGGWLHDLPTYVRAASRLNILPNYRVNDIGFRCVLVPVEKGSTPQTGG